jgi:DNA-binding NarL/FixJ family response regulator
MSKESGVCEIRRVRMKILIIDDHILFAEGMKFLLESFKQEIDTLYADDLKSALKIINEKGLPDLILLDVNLSGTSGFTLIDEFHQLNIWSPILIISATDTRTVAEMSLEKGALGFVSKSSDSRTLLKAIETVLRGDIYMPSHEASYSTALDSMSKVTSRQHEILYLLSQGLLNKQIASELSISANTVKAHLHEIFRHLNVTNRTAAVQSAHKYGLL